MMSVLGFAWFIWPISVSVAASFTATSLYMAAVRNGRSADTQRLVAAGAVVAFVLPAAAMTAGTDIYCSDNESQISLKTPALLLLALVAAGVVGLCCLRAISGRSQRRWLLPVVLLGVTLVGFFLETFLTLTAMSGYCDGRVILFYLQGGTALLLPPFVVAAARRPSSELGELPAERPRAW
jgi:hypothetical protein